MAEVANQTLVDGRYRVRERIGSGGMADVYCADDTQLGRKVALKVLHRRFAQDQEFVKRFQREAQSAAALQHPNVVNVFDRGEHEGTWYIAMEYLPGRTLKEVVIEEAPLDQLRAIDYTLEVLQAAGFAHRRGVIHRDLKPHNVILGPDGHAKVTDFGIARAGASEMTETGSIMGTAQYLSPEQAQGQGVTAASDLYSVGVILYELLTGVVPFAGDSAVSIALKHVSEPAPPPSQIRPELNPVLDAVVMRAMMKDPTQRFVSADEFTAALLEAREAVLSGDTSGTASFMPMGPLPAEERRPRRWGRWLLMLLALLAITGGALAWFLTRPDDVPVPNVVGEPFTQASQQLEEEGFEVEIERARNEAAEDIVFEQDPGGRNPPPDLEAEEGSTVVLYVSNGPGTERIPSVEGLPRAQAVSDLNEAGFRVDVDEEPSSSVEEGLVTRTVPGAGREVEIGSRVRLFVSTGPQDVDVPDVVGLSRSAAESELQEAGLTPVVDEQESDQPEGEVISQSPVAGTTVSEDSRVTITVSIGREEVSVPAVIGLSERAARGELSDAGFNVRVREITAEPEDVGQVVRQNPSAGSERREGSTVTIFVGVAPEGEPEPDDGLDDEDDGAAIEPGTG